MIVCPCTYDYSGGRTNGSGNSRLKPAEKGVSIWKYSSVPFNPDHTSYFNFVVTKGNSAEH